MDEMIELLSKLGVVSDNAVCLLKILKEEDLCIDFEKDFEFEEEGIFRIKYVKNGYCGREIYCIFYENVPKTTIISYRSSDVYVEERYVRF